jgi:ribonucleoside-diphosphate reductase alpha chain
MAGDFLNTYKYGWKTSYYQNTYDNKNDEIEEEKVEEKQSIEDLLTQILDTEEEACDSCAI